MIRTSRRLPATWFKSSYSNADGGACVEVAPGFSVVPVRDSKDPSIGHLVVAPTSWSAPVRTAHRLTHRSTEAPSPQATGLRRAAAQPTVSPQR